ncbi:MAG TPA: Xaa-Pro peptidase family protein [Terriglobales bacterium]|nr:Xaa-Pro peptidase family protein [Terriglobales bacterium]
MPTRRQFIQTGLAATATAATLPSLHAQEKNEKSSLPASIATLKSMKSQATPITVEERRERIARARQLMAENKLDAIVIAPGTSLMYFSNIRWWPSERFFAMILPAKGNPFYVCPAFEEGRAREQISRGPLGDSADVRIWQEDEDPYARLAQGLKDHGIATGRVGIEETMYYVFSSGLSKAASSAQFTSATPVTAGCRGVKSAHELELMRFANKVTLTAYEAAWKALHPGMTNRDFASLIAKAHDQLGFEGGAMVLVGEYSALPHGTIQPQTIKENDIVLIDGGCEAEGYNSDISRTFAIGKPTDKMKRVFDIVHRAQTAAFKAAKAGNTCGSVDDAARKVITDAGFGPDYKYFTHRLGHGIGLDGHEWPYLVRGNKTMLQRNMTFSDEPGIYIRGEFGVRLEDDQVITENGGELMTPQSPSLEQPFAS